MQRYGLAACCFDGSDFLGIRHQARAQGAVDLRSTRSLQDVGGVLGSYASATQDGERASHRDGELMRLANHLPQQGYTRLGRGLLARGEDAVTPHLCDLLHGLQRMATHIESTVEGDVAAPVAIGRAHGLHPLATSVEIDVAIGRKGAHNHPIDTLGHGHAYLASHLGHLGVGVNEMALARADEHMHHHTGGSAEAHRLAYHLPMGRKAVELQVAAQLYAVGATLDGTLHTLDVTAANF